MMQAVSRRAAPAFWGRSRPTIVRCQAGPAAPSKVKRIYVAHILAKEPAVLDDVEKQLKAGGDWAALCLEHSTCGSKTRKGELGWLEKGNFFPEFEAAAFEAPVGGLTRATTQRGHHLIKVMAERFVSPVTQMSAEELKEMLSNPALSEDVQFIDVREPWEFNTSKLSGFVLKPITQLPVWGPNVTQELDPAKETVVLCHHGVRSMQVAQFLAGQAGFENVRNVMGGIAAYSLIDPSVPRYDG